MRRWLVIMNVDGTEYRKSYECANSKQALNLAWEEFVTPENIEQEHKITVTITALGKKR